MHRRFLCLFARTRTRDYAAYDLRPPRQRSKLHGTAHRPGQGPDHTERPQAWRLRREAFRGTWLRARRVGSYNWMYRQISAQWESRSGRRPNGWRGGPGWCSCRSTRQEGLRWGRRPPASNSVWCVLRIPTSLGGPGTKPLCAVQSRDRRVTFPFRTRIVVPRSGIRLQFWPRSRRWCGRACR